jgi:hypothetical protein
MVEFVVVVGVLVTVMTVLVVLRRTHVGVMVLVTIVLAVGW